MSAVLIKAGIYGLVRVCGFGLGTPSRSWGLALLAIGALSAILGVLYALAQADLKRMLAYSTIENAGIIVLALGAGLTALAGGRGELAAVGLAAALLHVLNHAVFKGLLFLGAGSVVMATGTRQLEDLGGLLRRMPWTGACFAVGAASISALPPLNGFASEWLTFQALLLGFGATPGLARLWFPLGAALLALTSALAAACFVKALAIVFLARPRSQAAEHAHESPASMLVPQVLLAALCVALGLFPGRALQALGPVLASLPGLRPPAALTGSPWSVAPSPGTFDHLAPLALLPLLLLGLALAGLLGMRRAFAVRRSSTWGCGGELGAQAEYTATAFSKPLMMIFAAIYRPTRQVETLAEVSPYFPREVRYRSSIEPTFERFVYGPLTRGVLGLAGRMKVLQAGSLHAYLAYVLFLAVLLLFWLGGDR
jgi:hydrogenase-4 component B